MKPPFKWSLVTGPMFGAANKFSKKRGNPAQDLIRAKVQQLKAKKL